MIHVPAYSGSGHRRAGADHLRDGWVEAHLIGDFGLWVILIAQPTSQIRLIGRQIKMPMAWEVGENGLGSTFLFAAQRLVDVLSSLAAPPLGRAALSPPALQGEVF